jgi:hypothetical protein
MNWSTLIADPDGVIDYSRVRSLVSVLLAAAAGVMAVCVVFIVRDINEALVSIAVGALVLPLTGGKIADGIASRNAAAATAKVVMGQAPGRRLSDARVSDAGGPPA